MDGFRLVEQFMFSIVLRQISECDAPSRIHLVDVEVQPVDFGPDVALLGEILDQPNWNLAFDTLSIAFSGNSKKQHPRFALTACFFF